jgi:hypothetical protein
LLVLLLILFRNSQFFRGHNLVIMPFVETHTSMSINASLEK